MKTDNSQYYGSVTRLLHWLMAACFFFMFATAIAWNLNGELKFLIGPLHKDMSALTGKSMAIRHRKSGCRRNNGKSG